MIPQAYTARDIGEAYKWIQTLPPHMKEEFKTMEQMVLSYLKAKSMGTLANFSVEPPKKSHEFQKTLQNLKAEMDQFDFVPSNGEKTTSQVPPPPSLPNQLAFQQVQQVQQPPQQPPTAKSSPQTQAPPPSSPLSSSVQITQPAPPSPSSELKLDPRSRQIIHDIREGFNLSSDAEALRMSLVLAYKTLKNLIE